MEKKRDENKMKTGKMKRRNKRGREARCCT
jgi:hypothetical protein